MNASKRSGTVDRRLVLRTLAAISLAPLAGCGQSGVAFHKVRGRIQLAEGDSKILAGHHIEAAHETETFVRAFGVLEEDGQFQLETLHEGALRQGAIAGKYKLRLVLSDDDSNLRQQAAAVIPDKVFHFDTSGLAIEVPSAEEIQLRITKS